LKTSELPFYREEVYSEIKNLSGKNFGYDSEKSADKNKKALNKILKWVKTIR